MTREEFLAERKTGIGGSDIAHLLNIEPYGCRRYLWYDKRNCTPDYERDETAEMRRGNVLEAAAAGEFEHETGAKLETRPLLRHRTEDWAIVHVDRVLRGAVASDERLNSELNYVIAEIKCPGREMFMHIVRNGMPRAYALQAQHGMYVTGAKLCLFIVFCTDPWKVLYFPVTRDENVIALIEREGRAFWAQVQSGPSPEKLAATSAQCKTCPYRASCQGEAMIPKEDRKSDIPFDAHLVDAVARYVEMRQIEDEAGELVASARADLEKALGATQATDTIGFRVYFRWGKPRETVDIEKTEKRLRRLEGKVDYDGTFVPASVTPDKKTGVPSRTLRVYPK